MKGKAWAKDKAREIIARANRVAIRAKKKDKL